MICKGVFVGYISHSTPRVVNLSERIGGKMHRIVHFLNLHRKMSSQIMYKVIVGKHFNSNI